MPKLLKKLLNKLKKLLYKPKRSSTGYTANQIKTIAIEEYCWHDHPQLEELIQLALDNPGSVVEGHVNTDGTLEISVSELLSDSIQD